MVCRKFAPTLAECYSGLSARLQGGDVRASGREGKECGADASLEGTASALPSRQKVENSLSGGDQSCMQFRKRMLKRF